jgi:alanine racemase
LSNQAIVRVGDDLAPAPVRGAVNMDQIIIDVTHLPRVGRGATVEVYASDEQADNAVPHLAALAGTSIYEMLCRLSPRLTRQYVTTGASTDRRAHHVATAAGARA